MGVILMGPLFSQLLESGGLVSSGYEQHYLPLLLLQYVFTVERHFVCETGLVEHYECGIM